MGLILAGERSGAGKTTITLALLATLVDWGERVQSFKVGPDYLDPQWHRWVTGRPCPNLDTVLTSPAYVRDCYAYYTHGMAYALVEGVMGLFDGPNSTAEVAKLLGLPAALAGLDIPVVGECRRQAELHYPERHLGLIPPAERGDLHPWRQGLTTLGRSSFAWDVLRPFLQVQSESNPVPPWSPLRISQPLTIAVAWEPLFI